MRWPTVALLLACWAVSSAADVVPTPTVTITQNSSDDSALTALQSENAALKARVAELEAKGKAFEAMYEDFKRQYVNGCPHCALDPNVNPNPTAATNQQLRNEIDDLINKERDRQVCAELIRLDAYVEEIKARARVPWFGQPAFHLNSWHSHLTWHCVPLSLLPSHLLFFLSVETSESG